MAEWNYGGAYEENPIKEGEIAVWENGSKVAVNDLYNPIPKWFKDADCVFMDPPWNRGNLRTFYTKAERNDHPDNYGGFYKRVFEVIGEVHPHVAYVEIGKEYLPEYVLEMRKLFKYVTFYNSSYYHNKKNKCYIVRGSRKASKPDLDYMDEEDIIKWVCENETFDCILDACMGQGLVGRYASAAGRRFVGGELNPKRLAVLLKHVPGYKIITS